MSFAVKDQFVPEVGDLLHIYEPAHEDRWFVVCVTEVHVEADHWCGYSVCSYRTNTLNIAANVYGITQSSFVRKRIDKDELSLYQLQTVSL